MIYNFRNPSFIDKAFVYKEKEIENIEKTIGLVVENLRTIPGIIEANIVEGEEYKRKVKVIKGTLEKCTKINIKFNSSSNTKVLNYDIDVIYPIPEKTTLEFVINGVYRHPLFQLIDTVVMSKGVIRIIGTILTVHFHTIKGFAGISDKSTHMGNMMSYFYDLEWFLNKCNYKIDNIISKTSGVTLGDRLKIEKINPDIPDFDQMMEGFLSQKMNNKVKFNTKEFWYDMSNSYKYKKFNLIEYFDCVKKSDLFIAKKMKCETIAHELFERFINKDKFNNERGDLNRKDIILSQYILGPLFSEILSFLLSKNSYKIDKTKTVNITNYLSSKMPEMQHLADHSVTVIHSIGESLKTTYSGPQGLSRKAMPTDLRNIHDSYYGKLDSILTADRQQCGIINFLTLDTDMIE
ncbi:hypothetical protein M0R36_10355 [bacterium]|jgi:hypothetical protein|nr:hypothetical protein [bacterium]